MAIFRKQRSQVDAPIELVIAIIILLASLSISMLIFGNTSEQQCNSKLKGEIQRLQLAMQDLALQSPPSERQVFLTLPRCGGKNIDLVRFVYYSKPVYCRNCAGHFSSCWKVQLATLNPKTDAYESDPDQEICVDVAGNMDISQNTGPDCDEMFSNPCGAGSNDCNSGVPSDVFSGNVNDPSRWSTLPTRGQAYYITLKKGIGTCGGGASCPKIFICAQNAAERN